MTQPCEPRFDVATFISELGNNELVQWDSLLESGFGEDAVRRILRPGVDFSVGDLDWLLNTVYDNPDELAPRLAYAKRLTEQGDHRGEFISLQCDSNRGCASRRESALLKAGKSQWSGSLTQAAPSIRNIRFELGFPAAIRIGAGAVFPNPLPAEWSTIREIHVANVGSEVIGDMLADPVLRSLRVLTGVALLLLDRLSDGETRPLEFLSCGGNGFFSSLHLEAAEVALVEATSLPNLRGLALLAQTKTLPVLHSILTSSLGKQLTFCATNAQASDWAALIRMVQELKTNLDVFEIRWTPHHLKSQFVHWCIRLTKDARGKLSCFEAEMTKPLRGNGDPFDDLIGGLSEVDASALTQIAIKPNRRYAPTENQQRTLAAIAKGFV